MNILYVINSLVGGGAEKLMNDMLPIVKKTGNNCELLVFDLNNAKYYDSLINNGIKIKKVPDKNVIQKIIYIYKYIKRGKFDIVHVNLFPSLYYCSFIKRFFLKNTVFIYTEHNTDNRRRHHKCLRLVEKNIYEPYDYIVSISNGTKNKLIRWLGECNDTSNKYIVINNGINLEKFIYTFPIDINKIISNYSDEDKLLCMIGSFTEQKNHMYMLDVMKELPSNYKLILLGDGKLKDKIVEKINVDNLSERVVMLGFRNNIAPIVKASDLVVIPSKWEGFGLVAAEAMACGKQIVCNDVDGLSEVVGDVGVKVNINNKNEFKDAIIQTIEYGYDQQKCIDQASRCDIKNMVKLYIDLYNRSIMERNNE